MCSRAWATSRSRSASSRSRSRAGSARAEEGHALNTLGVCRSDVGDHQAGEAALRRALTIASELHRPDDIARAYCNLGDCVDHAGRIEEAAGVALDGVQACRGLGLLGGYPGLLLCDAAERLLRLGRCDEAERLVDRAIDARAGGQVDGYAQGTRALLDVARGAPAATREQFERARDRLGPGASISWTGPIDAGAAELELWEGRPGDARAVVGRAVAEREGQEDSFHAARLLWLGVRAEADLAERARAPWDVAGAREAGARAAELSRRVDARIAAERRDGAPAITRADALGIVATGAYGRWRCAELFMSHKTASVHVSRILRKLGARGRVEATAIAHRLGLV